MAPHQHHLQNLWALLETIHAAGGTLNVEELHSYAESMGYGEGTVEEWRTCLKHACLAGLVHLVERDCAYDEDIIDRTGRTHKAMVWELTDEGMLLGGWRRG